MNPYNFLVALLVSITIIILTQSSSSTTASSIGSLIYCGCTQLRYGINPLYEANINSLLTSLVNSAVTSYYNKQTVGSSTTHDTLYGLYQCRPDIQPSDCAACIANSVSQLGARCSDSCGGAVQLDGCFLKYDNRSFFGAEDKTVVEKNCGPPVGYDSAELTQVDSVLVYLSQGGGSYRVGGTGGVRGVAECLGDLTAGQCQDCLVAAIGQLRAGCEGAAYGDVFLGTCYARFSAGGTGTYSAPNSESSQNNNETDEDLAILIGIVVGVTLIVFFIAYFRRSREKELADGK